VTAKRPKGATRRAGRPSAGRNSDSPALSLRAYARHRGVQLRAVQKAIEAGRLVQSVTHDGQGRPRIVDAALADAEWDANTNAVKATPSLLKKALEAPPASSAPVPPVPTAPAAGSPSGPPLGDDGKPMTLLEASALEKSWKAKLAELDYQQQVGELVSAKEVEARTVEVFTRCRTKLLGIPSKAKTHLPNLSRGDLVTLDKLIREALEELTVDERAEGAA
jgi:hypothetical protein